MAALDPDLCLMLKSGGKYLESAQPLRFQHPFSITRQDVLLFGLFCSRAICVYFLQLAYPSQNNDRGGTARVRAPRADIFMPYCHGYFCFCDTAADKCLPHLSQAHLSPLPPSRRKFKQGAALLTLWNPRLSHNTVTAV